MRFEEIVRRLRGDRSARECEQRDEVTGEPVTRVSNMVTVIKARHHCGIFHIELFSRAQQYQHPQAESVHQVPISAGGQKQCRIRNLLKKFSS
jgi:hypothetical protein